MAATRANGVAAEANRSANRGKSSVRRVTPSSVKAASTWMARFTAW